MRKVVIGTFLSISQSCSSPECHYSLNWESQPFIKNLPLGNIMLSGSILFSGALPTKTLRVFENMRCATISCRTFFRHQETFLQPVIERVWSRQQTRLLEDLKRDKGPLVLGGDGRADSPGHSAKYGSYSVVDLLHNNIIDVQLVQSNEVANSNQMEKEGLMRAFELLMNKGLKIGTLITDRHVQIAKWVREEHPTVDHRYDVWHVAKGKYITTLLKFSFIRISKKSGSSVSEKEL
jgi:solute carrier family 8 (sodium/calcium exchanger)